MKTKLLIAGALIFSFAGSALADEYYVVREPHAKRCTVVTKKPVEDNTVAQIGPFAFKTRSEAENRMKTVKTCTSDVD
jgi:hypothetical protein